VPVGSRQLRHGPHDLRPAGAAPRARRPGMWCGQDGPPLLERPERGSSVGNRPRSTLVTRHSGLQRWDSPITAGPCPRPRRAAPTARRLVPFRQLRAVL
jgi:hypothetical protein